MNISDILKVRKKGEDVGFIVPTIDEQIIVDAIRDNSSRRRDVFHPSAICYKDFCPREWLLCQVDPSLYTKVKVTLQQQKRFDVGKVMHSYAQQKLANAGVLFGAWKCLRRCDGEHCVSIGFKPKTECKGNPIWVYDEPTVVDDELHVYGNTDGIYIKDNKKYIFEYKTMNDDGFSTLCSPVYDHREQSLWYLDIISRKGFAQWNDFIKADDIDDVRDKLQPLMDMPFDGTVIVYQNKDSQDMREYFTSASLLKAPEFMTDEKDSLKYAIDTRKQMLRDTLVHKENGTLCSRLHQCDDPSARRAKRCVASKLCFSKEG